MVQYTTVQDPQVLDQDQQTRLECYKKVKVAMLEVSQT